MLFPDDPNVYVIDGVELYDKPSDTRVQLVVQDTFTGEVLIVDPNGDQVSVEARDVPTQISLVTLVRTDDGWRIAPDQNITDPATQGNSAELALGPEEPDQRAASERGNSESLTYTTTFWKPPDGKLCLQIRILNPAFGPRRSLCRPCGRSGDD